MVYSPFIFIIIGIFYYFVKFLTKEIIMTKKELAKRLDIDVKTLNSWEENRPEVMRLIKLGLHAESHIQDVEKYLKKLKDKDAS